MEEGAHLSSSASPADASTLDGGLAIHRVAAALAGDAAPPNASTGASGKKSRREHAEASAIARCFVAASVAASGDVDLPGAIEVPDRELARTLRALDQAPDAVAVAKINATLMRVLRELRPALVIVAGDADPQDLHELETLPCCVLGPRAAVRRGTGALLVCAANRDELRGLQRALDRDDDGPGVHLALSPTPGWLDALSRTQAFADRGVVGYVPARALHLGWARWFCSDGPEATLVPLGIEVPRLEPRAQGLEAAVAAHTLERFTGPVFPAPRVLALLHRGVYGGPLDGVALGAADPDALDVWAQARRALPLTGGALGMESPDTDVPVDVPTAAFLAQRARLRARQRTVLVDEAERHQAPDPDPDLLERALEVLSNSAEVLSDHESKVVLRGVEIEITRQAVANSASGAANYADQIGFPVVLKALSPDLRRKAEVGAVALDLQNAAAVRRAYASIMAAVQERAPTARVDGVVVAEQVPAGLEINCGALRTRDGAVAMYGQVAGIGAQFEPALALAPETSADAVLLAHAVLGRVPVPALRRASDPDVHTLADLFHRLALLFAASGDRLLGAELGPVRLVGGDRGYVVLDARLQQRPHLEGL